MSKNEKFELTPNEIATLADCAMVILSFTMKFQTLDESKKLCADMRKAIVDSAKNVDNG